MNKQINLRFTEAFLKKIQAETKKQGFSNVQELIKNTLRKSLYEAQEITLEEMAFVKKLYKVSEEKNLYGTEKELFSKLNKK